MIYSYQHSEEDIIASMSKFGGSFVKQLAVLWYRADDNNQKKLEEAFHSYFIKYDEMAAFLVNDSHSK
jgi:hypothetical protein